MSIAPKCTCNNPNDTEYFQAGYSYCPIHDNKQTTPDTQLPAEWLKEIKQCAKRNIKTPDWGESVQIETGIACATEYATKLHQAQQEITRVREAYDSCLFKRQESEKLNWLFKNQNNAMRALLEKVIYRHEGGLLPDRLLYNDIKTFLDGTK
jgi:hypothetical protein